MVKCNLAVLLAERNLKITAVSSKTGISRTTITALCNNASQGIQFDTLNTLCQHLKVTPADFFSYLPFDVEIKANSSVDYYGYDCGPDSELIDFIIKDRNQITTLTLEVYHNSTYIDYYDDGVDAELKLLKSLDIIIDLSKSDELEIELRNIKIATFTKYFQKIPVTYRRDIENEIVGIVLSHFYDVSEDVNIQLIWPEYLD